MAIPLDSDLMRSFLAVAETGSVTAAAERVGRTQSAVSMQIKRLEDSLGQTLFARLPRGVALTERGAQLMPYAQRTVQVLDEAAVALRERPLTGPIRIGIPDEYSETMLPRVLAAFAEQHPSVEVTVRLDYSAPLLAALAADELDLAVSFDWSRGGPGEVLGVDPAVWVTSVVHNQHLRHPLPVAAYFRSDWCRDFAIASLERHAIRYRVAYECDVSAGLRVAVRIRSCGGGAGAQHGARGLPRTDGGRGLFGGRYLCRGAAPQSARIIRGDRRDGGDVAGGVPAAGGRGHMTVLQAAFDTPTGRMRVTETDGAITGLRWAARAQEDDRSELIEAVVAQLGEYFARQRQAFDLPLAPAAEAFQMRFLWVLRAIPYGETRSYGEIAREMGVSAQAIGQACGANPIPVLIPCHRVLGAQGLGGFSGGMGVETKVELLKLEGAAGLLI